MKVIVAHAEVDGVRPDAELADALERRARADGHDVMQLVMPDAARASPQERALPWQLLPVAAYGDELWSINFPACALRHARRRVWLTRAEPFGTPCASLQALRRVLAADEGDVCVMVTDGALAARLRLEGVCVEIAERGQDVDTGALPQLAMAATGNA